MNKKVFIVHGRDERAKAMIAQAVERLDLQPVVLHEQANQGMTLIEKFSRHSDAGFAVVILTGDDVGRPKDARQWRSRARQNVIFEFGFFIDKLGRNRVCVLHEPGVELPTDLAGVVYTTLDPGGRWQIDLARELKAAGYPVDVNKLL